MTKYFILQPGFSCATVHTTDEPDGYHVFHVNKILTGACNASSAPPYAFNSGGRSPTDLLCSFLAWPPTDRDLFSFAA
jgi:hypothetical protein